MALGKLSTSLVFHFVKASFLKSEGWDRSVDHSMTSFLKVASIHGLKMELNKEEGKDG